MIRKALTLMAAVLSAATISAKTLDVIPAPSSVTFSEGTCDVRCVSTKSSISKKLGPEAYEITVKPSGIRIKAGGEAGKFYALQTLSQMEENYDGMIPCCTISDAPRFAWRGFMLDESRHYFGMAYVKKVLDEMARYKMNRFHWHLTDSQGWRLEIEAYPRLTEVGAWGNYSDAEAAPHYYTKDQVREIIAYAAQRHIEVIPEIDMPGHATAANRSYPEYSGGGSERFPDFTFNVGSEATYRYLETILKEVAELFPTKYLHIGGDEVFFGNQEWNTNPDIQALIKREKLDGIKGAEGYFVKRMAAFVRSIGKTPILWCDALEVGIPADGTVIHWWRHDMQDHLHKGLSGGFREILSPRLPMYFDYVQAGDHVQGPKRSNCWCSQDDLYNFPDMQNTKGDPHTRTAWNLTEEEEKNILGIQANLWTERVANTSRADFMIFPRLCALAEAAWTVKEAKNYAGFTGRMEKEYRHLDSKGIYYYDLRNPGRTPEPSQPAVFNKK